MKKFARDYESLWFSTLADVGSEPLFARACMAPTRRNLEALAADLRGSREPYAAGIRAEARAILRRELGHEFRYHFGGYATRGVTVTLGKVSATSHLFSLIRQAARYGATPGDWMKPPMKLRKTRKESR